MPTFKIAGKPHDVRCGIAEHIAIWKITGKNLLAGESPLSALTPENISGVLQILLDHAGITVEEVEAEITGTRRFLDAFQVITETFNDGLEDAVKAEENPLPAASESAPSAATI